MNNKVEFIEYGKVFSEYDATDFQILDRSSDDLFLLLQVVKDVKILWMASKVAEPASKSFFIQKIPNHSVAFLKFRENYYLFVQIQRRKEGEYARSIKNSPRLNRLFNGVKKYSLIKKEQVDNYISHGFPLFSNLLYKNSAENNLGKHDNALKDYIQPGIVSNKTVLPQIDDVREINLLGDDTVIRLLVNSIIEKCRMEKDAFHLEIKLPELEWKERLEIVEFVQILVYPVVGCFFLHLMILQSKK